LRRAARGWCVVALCCATALVAGLGAWWLTRPIAPPRPVETVYRVVDFAQLVGWAADRQEQALPALAQSCRRFNGWPDEQHLGPPALGLSAADWKAACAALAALPAEVDSARARAFFEAEFRPVEVRAGRDPRGLFTGYYEPLLQGSLSRDARHRVPLYALPGDLVQVDLGRFDPELKGRRLAGRVEKGQLMPYPDRAEIEAKGLAEAPVLVWVDDAVDAFFLHIQGSGRVSLADGGELRVGYAGQNGRPYHPIGRELLRSGALTRDNVSMQSIRAWLEANPGQAQALMNGNPSYVFFRALQGPGPLGALGVPLTPERSLAVDRRAMPLGAPVWLETTRPDVEADKPEHPFRRLMLSQDTGGAIRGAVRGDVFWGHGPAAYEIAGRMKQPGRWYLLLPTAAAVRLLEVQSR
jgi:peptidoglycan lytic transglycosylase A